MSKNFPKIYVNHRNRPYSKKVFPFGWLNDFENCFMHEKLADSVDFQIMPHGRFSRTRYHWSKVTRN